VLDHFEIFDTQKNRGCHHSERILGYGCSNYGCDRRTDNAGIGEFPFLCRVLLL